MRFVVDAQLPPKLVNWLRQKGHDASHVLTDLGEGVEDQAIMAYASGAVIVSKDEDFIGLFDESGQASKLLWIRCGNTRNAALFAILDREWARIEGEFLAGASVVEVG